MSLSWSFLLSSALARTRDELSSFKLFSSCWCLLDSSMACKSWNYLEFISLDKIRKCKIRLFTFCSLACSSRNCFDFEARSDRSWFNMSCLIASSSDNFWRKLDAIVTALASSSWQTKNCCGKSSQNYSLFFYHLLWRDWTMLSARHCTPLFIVFGNFSLNSRHPRLKEFEVKDFL